MAGGLGNEGGDELGYFAGVDPEARVGEVRGDALAMFFGLDSVGADSPGVVVGGG